MEDLEDLLIELEQEIKDGKKALFGNGVTVNPDVIFSIVDKIRENLPSILKDARFIVAEREHLMSDVNNKIQNMIESAHKQRNELLSNSSIVSEAQKEANIIKNQANEYQTNIKFTVKKDIDKLLTMTEDNLKKSIAIIQNAQSDNRRD